MANFDQWCPELLLAAPTAAVPLVHQCVNRAARTFLRKTRAWQEWLEPASVSEGAFVEYGFDLPMGAEISRMERATLNGQCLMLANARDLNADPMRHKAGIASYLASNDLSSFTVHAPSGGQVQVFVTLIPALRATQLPDHIASQYHDAILQGAKAELLNTGGTDYYKPDQAAVALAFFTRAMDEHGTEVWRSSTGRVSRGRTRWL